MRGLGGATRKEKTRDELLEALRMERAARSGAKQRARAAATIQKVWRGHRARRRLREALVADWAATYGALVSAPESRISGQDVADKLLPPLLYLLKPHGATLPAWAASKAVARTDAAPAAVATAGDAVVLPPPGSPLSNMIRGSLALLLRTCSATNPRDSYLALALAADGPQTAAWRNQSWRLLCACCRLVASPSGTAAQQQKPHHQQQQQQHKATGYDRGAGGGGNGGGSGIGGGGGDAVIDAAAIRVAVLLTDASAWKCLVPLAGGGNGSISAQHAAAEAAASHLRSRLAQQPQCLFAALARLLAVRQQQQQQQPGAQPKPHLSSPASNTHVPTVAQQQHLSRLLGLVMAVLRSALDLDSDLAGAAPHPSPPQALGGSPTSSVPDPVPVLSLHLDSRGPGSGGARSYSSPPGSSSVLGAPGLGGCQACLSAFCRLVLVAPGLVALVPQDMQIRFRSSGAFARLCRSVRQQLVEREVVGATAAAWCLTNLLQLLLGPYMHVLGPAAAAAASGGEGGKGGGGGVVGVLSPPPDSLWGVGGEVAGELAATAAALLGHVAGGSSGRREGSTELSTAVSGMWPLGQRGLLLPLLTALESRSGGVESFADMCCAAMELMPRLSASFTEEGIQADVPGVLNALAFSPGVLPRLWRWLCFALGLPRECPAGSTRGLNVAALSRGYAILPPRGARVLGLFCRVYAQLLLVLDDGEFYELQQPLELSAARAVGTSLNSLVFHTYLPKPYSDSRPGPPPPAPSDPHFALLIEWAPRLLRALYERDVRRLYCQSMLWLAPYMETFGLVDEQPGPPPQPSSHRQLDDSFTSTTPAAPDASDALIGPFTAGSVLRALLYGGGGDGGEAGDEADSCRDAVSAAAVAMSGATTPSLQTSVVEYWRPHSLAALLKVSPQAVPFSRRVDLLRALLAEDKRRGRWELPLHSGGVPPIKVTVHRNRLIEDAYAGLAHRGTALKARLQVLFVNEAGLTEAGLDFGGLQKELLERVVSAGLDANYGLFTSTPDGLIYPNPAAERLDGGLALLEFMGLMFGKALYEGILLPVPFAHFFVARLQGRQPLFDDLASLDPELHKNLLMVKRYEGDVSDLGLTFSADTDFLGCPVHHELLPGRGDMPVINDSRLLYCHLLADWHLTGKLGAPTAAFARGLFTLIQQASLRLFNPREFNQLLSGAIGGGPGSSGAAPLDLADMQRWTRYSGGYSPDSTTVKLFWRVVSELTADQQSALLRFVTSCSRPPLGGFRYLQPPLTVHKVDCEAGLFAILGGRDVDRLPSASTCYNMLKLPNYRRAVTLKTKLLYSISSGAGFELS